MPRLKWCPSVDFTVLYFIPETMHKHVYTVYKKYMLKKTKTVYTYTNKKSNHAKYVDKQILSTISFTTTVVETEMYITV